MNTPKVSITAACVLVVLGVVAIAIDAAKGHDVSSQVTSIVALVGIVVPGLIAAGYSERTSKDVRNGVMEQKVKNGTVAALVETGVTDIVNSQPATTQAVVGALTKLLQDNIAATNVNTNAVQANTAQTTGKHEGV